MKKNKLFAASVIAIFLISIISILPASHATSGGLPVGLLIPLYNNPPSSQWTSLIASKNAHPTVPMIVIINPDTGPGGTSQSNYVTEVSALQAAGIIVIGYVPTNFAGYSTGSVETNMSRYNSWYHVNGILFDEMSPFSADSSYYSTLATYAYLTLGFNTTVGNPGVEPDAAMIGIFNITNIYENSGMPAPIDINFYYPSTPASSLGYIAHNVGSLPSQSTLSNRSAYAKWIFITDNTTPNPYATLPSYWSSEVALVASINGILGPSTVAPLSNVGAYFDGRNAACNSNGFDYVFYQNGTDFQIYYRSAPDALTWNHPTQVSNFSTAISHSVQRAICQGGIVYLIYDNSTTGPSVFYSKGTLSAGSITWTTQNEFVTPAPTQICNNVMSITLDSSGNPWITMCGVSPTSDYDSLAYKLVTGTWTLKGNFSYGIDPIWSNIVGLSSGKMALITLNETRNTFDIRTWSGSAFNSPVYLSYDVSLGEFATNHIGDRTFLIAGTCSGSGPQNISEWSFPYGGSWSSRTQVLSDPTSIDCLDVSLASDNATNLRIVYDNEQGIFNYTTSSDSGASWSAPRTLSNSEGNSGILGMSPYFSDSIASSISWVDGSNNLRYVRFINAPNSTTTTTTTTTSSTATTATQTITKYVYVPPSQASLNFWYFDLVLVGAIGGIFLFVTYWFQGDNDDSVQMLLIGIVTGAFVAFTAGMLPLIWLVVTVATYFVYQLRGNIIPQ